MVFSSSMATLLFAASLLFGCVAAQRNANTDQFTYQTTAKSSPNNQYPPNQWKKVQCGNLEKCVGWPEKFLAAPDWELEENDCEWCPASGSSCAKNTHQSPIDLQRNRAINESEHHNQCVDAHLMHRADSSCTWDELIRLNAFSIERHALQIKQPIESYEGSYRNACGRHVWGKIDYSKGLSDWWWLSHTDVHVPSEHTQEGKRYDAEIQLYHFYSVTAEEAGVPNQMGTVSILLEAYDGADDYDVLNKIICQWRRVEDETRKECGLGSVSGSYGNCGGGSSNGDASLFNRNLRSRRKAQSIHDVLTEKLKEAHNDPSSMYEPLTVSEKEDYTDSEVDWNELVKDAIQQEQNSTSRNLAAYDEVAWNNYFALDDVKTEYYFRYSGSQTIPPCYGKFLPGSQNRASTNHWRIMKDPIRISTRQLNEMHRLLKHRIASANDPIRPCQPDTAGAPYAGNDNYVNVSRPLQQTHDAHYMTFCECRWRSKFVEDQMWCSDEHQERRFYQHPYNFDQDGF
ncbi:hypothetical protein MPSEU_000326400 [Mayamaea pseudoterrestris]|nr:hypothetical protein MPSEU_000326400 [Mayamaea pseudoterrestris]